MENIILLVMLCLASFIILNLFQIKFRKNNLVNIKLQYFYKRSINSYIPSLTKPAKKNLTHSIDKDIVLIESALSLILKHYSDPNFNSEKLASLLNTSQRNLQRKFKLLKQSSPSKEIKNHRLTCAVNALNTGQKIKSVVFDCGFSSQSYFSKCFKEYYGCSPSDYLLNNK